MHDRLHHRYRSVGLDPAGDASGRWPSDAGDHAVETTDLTITYGASIAVRELSLSVPRGQVLAVLGPNGAGKSSLIKALTTLTPPTSGSVRVAGFDVRTSPEEVRRRISLSGQYSAVDGDLTVRENLVLIGRLYGIADPRGRAGELRDDLGLGDVFDRRVGQLSGGNQRRTDLALSLVNSPEVLFLDEPTTGLDPRARQSLWEVLGTVTAAGTTLVLTTQYLEEADRLAEKVIVMDGGRQVEAGSPAELKRRIGGHVITFRTTQPEALDRLHDLVGNAEGVTHISTQHTELVVNVTDSNHAVAVVGAARGIDLAGVEISSPTLDDVFFAVTGGTSS